MTGKVRRFTLRRLAVPALAALSAGCLAALTAGPASSDFIGTGNEMTLAEAWNGTAWSVVKTPHP